MLELLKKWGWLTKPPKEPLAASKSNFGKSPQLREIENLEETLTALQHGLLTNLENIINDES